METVHDVIVELTNLFNKHRLTIYEYTRFKNVLEKQETELKKLCPGAVSGSLHIDFGIWLTGHDKETIEQMFIDWHKWQ